MNQVTDAVTRISGEDVDRVSESDVGSWEWGMCSGALMKGTYFKCILNEWMFNYVADVAADVAAL